MFTKDRRTLQVVWREKVFVRSPGGLVTLDPVSSFGVYLLALLSFQAHPASDPADICTHAVVWRLTLTGTPCKAADIPCRVYLLFQGLPRARVVRRLSYHNGLAALNLSISARGAIPSSLLGLEAAVGIEPTSLRF